MEYKVGDTVTIRQWNDMKKEFGLNDGGGIKISNILNFAKEMNKYCGKSLKIKAINNNDFKLNLGSGQTLNFSEEMFEKEKTLFNLKVGDIVINSDKSPTKILGVHSGENPLYHLSGRDSTEYGITHTAKDLVDCGYIIEKL